jgi:TRAP-type C4-dicarboxylate transport system permease small subunit
VDREVTVLGRPVRLAFGAGAIALLAAMAVDFASVVGRHLGFPFLGSIEIVQLLVVVAASAALVGATLSGAHAAVHVITERLPPGQRQFWARVAALLGALFFALLCAGSAWLAADTLPGDERSELLQLPFFPFRLIWTAACGFTAILFAVQIVRPPPPSDTPHEP